MDADDWTRLQARCCQLELEILANEKSLDALDPAVDQDERAWLTDRMQAQLAQLGEVNARLSELRGPGAFEST